MDSIFNISLMLFMLLIFCFQSAIVMASFPSTRPLCHIGERNALLKFKQSLIFDESASSDPHASKKLANWELQGENASNCCSWDGVECENETGHVIGLELNSSFLFGSVSLTTLVTLVHLQRLNLSDNDFNYSHIPSEIGSVSRLTVLDLSQSNFFGNIPQEISKLSKLASLRIFGDEDPSSSSGTLKLENLTFTSLLQNLTQLEELDLRGVDISSKVPDLFANLSSLETLNLRACDLYGNFPMSIFHLPKLRVLNVRHNENLRGHLPEFQQNNNLEVMSLRATSFSGKLPESIGNLSSLGSLDLSGCKLSGSIPASLGNLSKLTHVDLESNYLRGQVPNLGSLSKLDFLSLSNNSVSVDTLSWLHNLRNLVHLFLDGIDLSGSILSAYPKNNFSASVGLVSNSTLPNFVFLSLSSCSLKGFPDFLRHQREIEILDLDKNEIHGKIPMWFSNISKESLGYVDLSQNLLTGFDQNQNFLSWSNIRYVDLSDNIMQGTIPIPPPSVAAYFVNNNRLSGKIPSSLCNLSSLQILDLSYNSLTGMIPPCLSNSSDSLSILKLRENNLQGPVPQTFKERSKLKLIDFSRNKLTGKVPRSLEKCKSLRSLDLSNNLFEDVFPFWLGSLPVLQVMLLGSNKFHGEIGNPKSEQDFAKLHICDLSSNNFTGNLPSKYFLTWGGMLSPKSEEDEYMVEPIVLVVQDTQWLLSIAYSMAITNKGVKANYAKISNILAAIDFSSNQFEGEIPEIIGNLKGLELLNLSKNGLIGSIPSSLGNLSNLESLDISRNKLIGEIPQELVELNFLEVLNVSYNNLSGPIPKGGQLKTFLNNSYEGNSGLCGDPLSRKCENNQASPPSYLKFGGEDKGNVFPSGVEWLVIGLGYGSGVIVGMVIGRQLVANFHKWYIEKFKI